MHIKGSPILTMLYLSLQDTMVRSVLSSQPQTIVVLHVPGAVLMPWAVNASTILTGFMPGQADGNAIVVSDDMPVYLLYNQSPE